MNRHNWKVKFGITLALMVMAAQAWAARPETTTVIDVPGALQTVASGINADGAIVGWYCLQTCNPARFRGFIRYPDASFQYLDANDCGSLPTSDCHPAIGTQPRYISPQGIVIGDYVTLEDSATLGNPRFRGFAWFEGSFTYFDAPDQTADGQPVYDNPSFAHSIIPRAINANGDLVGCIHDKNQGDSMHGFLLHDGNFTILGSMTMNNGVNAEGEVVGLIGGAAYRIDKFGATEPVELAGTDAANAWDINGKGEIVGAAVPHNATAGHAFLRSKNGDYQFIDPPGASSSTAFGISSSGNVVGQFKDSSGIHGFLLQRGED